LKQPIKILRL